MSSHREAPEISKDPVADSTDTYAFVSPDQPDTVTLISNYIPLEEPPGGPNFFEFGNDVLYEIKIDNDGDGLAEITYQFRFQTETRNPNTFLYNTGQITSISSSNWNRPQFYSVTKVDASGHSTVLGTKLACPPCNIGPRSTPIIRRWLERLFTNFRAAKLFSQDKGPRGSTWTLARSSTLPTCALSRICISFPVRLRRESMGRRDSTFTPSRSRCTRIN